MYNFLSLKQKLAEAEEWLKKELSGVRTGRASPAIVEKILVDAYGSKMPVNQVASITIEDARTLRIAAWDQSLVKAIESAIAKQNLGVSVAADEKGLRVVFPELTSERRTALVKLIKERLEEARKTIRSARDEVWGDLQKKERDGELPEDEKFRFKDEMQKMVDDGNEKLEEMFERKEKEIMS